MNTLPKFEKNNEWGDFMTYSPPILLWRRLVKLKTAVSRDEHVNVANCKERISQLEKVIVSAPIDTLGDAIAKAQLLRATDNPVSIRLIASQFVDHFNNATDRLCPPGMFKSRDHPE